ncbi:MAG: thymidine phosphorylase [Sulfobacillus acidophilus]|uniref:Pyrimidine-nucleoside phosphorylase n=1 Tax=Sulfobacillus acidophilus TaxID=53633 RepID=A0A2T2WNT8_9FIRM|nr:MAG: thymidine phosphorylase [Sulfobacillus acidophilus]
MIDIIEKTRDGIALSYDDIEHLVAGIVDNTWPDYQLSAWLMAVVLNGLTDVESFWLTGAMAFSHPQPDPLGLVDKHSTGGVGDKTTLVLAPLMASLGLPMAKMSGRGLGHTGGTLDKLESIPGFKTTLDVEDIKRQVEEIGVAVVAQSGELAPADRRLYALRDVTGTVNNISLIASSIMSKKLAAGTPNLVLDVKVGSGAFMANLEQARALAQLMVRIGRYYNRNVTALITSMQQPLGWAVGNAIEVNEAMDCLQQRGPADLREEVLALAAELIHLAHGTDLNKAHAEARAALEDGRAWTKFTQWVARQGGSPQALDGPLPLAPVRREWHASTAGRIASLNTRGIGQVALNLGAGRHRLEDAVDPAVGLLCYVKVGQVIQPGDLLGVVYARTNDDAQKALDGLAQTVRYGETTQRDNDSGLILDRVTTVDMPT